MPDVIALWQGTAPGSELAMHTETTYTSPTTGQVIVRNVSVPTLTAYLPDPAIATGTAAVVAPGGAFHLLDFDGEGEQVAEWLAQRGVAAFVLKYRLEDTGPTDADFERFVTDFQARYLADGGLRPVDVDQLAPEVQPLAVADGQQAVRLVRQRASDWGIDPAKVGFLGFSAGAFVATGVVLGHDLATRPDFVAPIYGGAVTGDVPADAPPLFAVVAADDILCLDACLGTVQAWLRAGRPAELHVYEQGGHGFGARKLGLPVDGWLERLADWLQSRGFLP